MAGRVNDDPFGKAIFEYYGGNRSEEHKNFGCRTWFSDYTEWFSRERKAIKLAKGRVLDIGCAAGRHSLYLQAKGHEVLAIDNSPLAIEVCKKRGVKNTACMSLTQLTYKLGIFDTILMLGNNFGLVGTPGRCRWVLRRLRRMTSPDAIILAGSGDIRPNDNPEIAARVEQNVSSGRYPGQWVHQLEWNGHKARVEWMYAAKQDMVELVQDTGWTVVEIIEDDEFTGAFVGVLKKVNQG